MAGKQEELQADRFKSINEMWRHSPREFTQKYSPVKEITLTNSARIVWQVLWCEAYSEKKGSRENYWATGPMSLSQITARADLAKQTVLNALNVLYKLRLVIQSVKGGNHSKGSEFLVWNYPKQADGKGV